MWHVWGRIEMHAGFWWGNLKERDNVENLGIDGRIILQMYLKRNGMGGHGLDLSGSG
jgi:hypothetical protein